MYRAALFLAFATIALVAADGTCKVIPSSPTVVLRMAATSRPSGVRARLPFSSVIVEAASAPYRFAQAHAACLRLAT